MKIKTLVIVDNQNLMKQWIKAFLEFTDLTEDDIGVIQQKFFGIDRPVIIAMAQTLVSKVKDIKNSFKAIDAGKVGLVIYDEVHATSSAPMFSKVSLLFRTKNMLGLSATPFQTGVSEVLMKNTIGEVIYETNRYDTTPEYRLVFYKSDLDNKKTYLLNRMDDYIKRKSIYNKIIIDSQAYLDVILKQTKKAREEGHRIIIICFTRIQVKTISELLTNNGLTNTRFYGEERDIDFTENILVATYSFCGKG
jgi:superfamily II DNA or RNA helicase